MDFTKSIYIEPNMDLDKVDKNDDPLANEPNNGLGLTKKAIARKGINDNNLKINKKCQKLRQIPVQRRDSHSLVQVRSRDIMLTTVTF